MLICYFATVIFLAYLGQGPSNPGKLMWNLLGFYSFIFIFGQCVNFLSGVFSGFFNLKSRRLRNIYVPCVLTFLKSVHQAEKNEL